MKIAAAQIRPFPGDIERNTQRHLELIEKALSPGADLLIFPELSLTGYEPKLAQELAFSPDDKRLELFREISDKESISIGVGLPLREKEGVRIGMMIFQPGQSLQLYAKQFLHEDELPYFVPGRGQLIFTVDNCWVAPAICYESLLPEHADCAVAGGAEMYAASVAKSAGGLAKAYAHYPKLAKQYGIPVLMSNACGPCDDFISAGESAIWNSEGELAGKLDETSEGILVLDLESGETIYRYF